MTKREDAEEPVRPPGSEFADMPLTLRPGPSQIFGPWGRSFKNYEGAITAGAMTSASVSFTSELERIDWYELPKQLAQLSDTHLHMIADATDPVIPKLKMLTNWAPHVANEQTVKLAAIAVRNEKLAARERSHGRTIAWIGIVGALVTGVAGFLLGRLA